MKRIKKILKRNKDATPAVERITNETVAVHREQILAGGRKFKYPVQYARHRLVINTIIIALVAFIILIAITWWQLYIVQNTGSFFYRATQLVSLPVAKVDGYTVPYSNYLMQYRSSTYWLEKKTQNFNIDSKDGQRQSEHIKRQALNGAIEGAYAEKLAEKYGVIVTDAEIDTFIDKSLQVGGRELSRKTYESVLSDSYGVSVDEYRSIVRIALLKQKIAFKVDSSARQRIKDIEVALSQGKNFDDVAVRYSEEKFAKATKGDVGFVPKDNRDQGLVEEALKLEKGQVSGVIKGTDGYYIVKLIDTNDAQVRYARIKVELKQFEQNLATLKKQHKVQEYITISKNG